MKLLTGRLNWELSSASDNLGTLRGPFFVSKYSIYIIIMDDKTKAIFELYNLMEEKLDELGISFDEFTILYKGFRNPEPKEEKPNSNPFPWVQAAGTGWR